MSGPEDSLDRELRAAHEQLFGAVEEAGDLFRAASVPVIAAALVHGMELPEGVTLAGFTSEDVLEFDSRTDVGVAVRNLHNVVGATIGLEVNESAARRIASRTENDGALRWIRLLEEISQERLLPEEPQEAYLVIEGYREEQRAADEASDRMIPLQTQARRAVESALIQMLGEHDDIADWSLRIVLALRTGEFDVEMVQANLPPHGAAAFAACVARAREILGQAGEPTIE